MPVIYYPGPRTERRFCFYVAGEDGRHQNAAAEAWGGLYVYHSRGHRRKIEALGRSAILVAAHVRETQPIDVYRSGITAPVGYSHVQPAPC